MQNIYYICNAIFYKMQERFKQLLEEKNLTATRFAAMIKVNASAMSHILNGRSKPGFDVLDKIAQAFPDVNLNWLISGKGSLYNNRISTPAKEVEKIPVQKNLFEEEECIVILIETILHVRYVMKLLSDKWICVEEEEKRFPIEEKNTKAEEILRPAVSVASIPTAKGKKVKRIILFFEDGSFEDYEK